MSLSGNLGFVSIDEVLRLISRSHQQGSVNVTGQGFHGRVFVSSRGIDLATTSDDAELKRHLLNSGLVETEFMARVDAGTATLSDLQEGEAAKVIGLFREMTVESLYQIGEHGETFDVHEGEMTRFASPSSFELESVIADAAKRAAEWLAVSRIVPDLAKSLRFERDLGERSSVEIAADAWKVLTEIGSGSSVEEIADRLGTTRFWTARVAGGMVEDDLLNMNSQASGIAEDVASRSSDWREPAPETVAADEADADVESAEETVAETETDQDETADPDDSWWVEPDADEDSAERTTEALEEEQATESMFGRFAARAGAAVEGTPNSEVEAIETPTPTLTVEPEETVEDDTEAFLEKVFSELGSTDEEPDEEEGYGLLRRRRLGAARDLSSDS